jgi:hypothetical protein
MAPTLDRGDIVILDNLRTHKVAGAMEAIQAADAAAFFLPAYSLLRKAAERTVPDLWRTIRPTSTRSNKSSASSKRPQRWQPGRPGL